VRVAIAYGVTAWLLAQIATQIFPFFEIPNWGVRLVILALLIGFPIVLRWLGLLRSLPKGLCGRKRACLATQVVGAPTTPSPSVLSS